MSGSRGQGVGEKAHPDHRSLRPSQKLKRKEEKPLVKLESPPDRVAVGGAVLGGVHAEEALPWLLAPAEVGGPGGCASGSVSFSLMDASLFSLQQESLHGLQRYHPP